MCDDLLLSRLQTDKTAKDLASMYGHQPIVDFLDAYERDFELRYSRFLYCANTSFAEYKALMRRVEGNGDLSLIQDAQEGMEVLVERLLGEKALSARHEQVFLVFLSAVFLF